MPVLLGKTTFRNLEKDVLIEDEDRRRHFYVIGKTGMGKSVLLENMAIQDILQGKGVGFVDPHGDTVEDILDYIPKERIKDVFYFNPQDLDFPVGFNPMEKVSLEERHLVSSLLLGTFKKIWPDVWSARMEYILANAILALLEIPGSTILSIHRMLGDPYFRQKIIERLKDPVIKSFWQTEFARYTQAYEVEATAAIQNKIGQFISNPLIRNILGQTKSTFNLRKKMDEGKIVLVNLSKGKIGEENSKLLGSLFITQIYMAAMSRVDTPEEQRKDFFLYVDEFQNFATESFVNILSEARKYRLNLTLAHQYLSQLKEVSAMSSFDKIKDAILGNVGTIVTFRVGPEDAAVLSKEFSPEVLPQDMINLPKHHVFVKMTQLGIPRRPFSAKTLPLPPKPSKSYKKEIIEHSRKQYSKLRMLVEKEITAQFENTKVYTPLRLYDAVCSLCGKKTKVPFLPDPEKLVYCDSCLKKIEKEKIGKVSLREILEKTVSFKKSKKHEKKD